MPIDLNKLCGFEFRFPSSIKVRIKKSKDGGYWIEILSFPGCFTQINDIKDLIVMVNDAIYCYLEIPEVYKTEMPRYFPNERMRKQLETWEKCIPANFLNKSIQFSPGIATK